MPCECEAPGNDVQCPQEKVCSQPLAVQVVPWGAARRALAVTQAFLALMLLFFPSLPPFAGGGEVRIQDE